MLTTLFNVIFDIKTTKSHQYGRDVRLILISFFENSMINGLWVFFLVGPLEIVEVIT